MSGPVCSCYVGRMTAEQRFGVRRGAHALSCAVYVPSMDPVDRENDADLRKRAAMLADRWDR